MFSMESGNERLGQPSSQSYFNPDPGFPESISCVGERSSIWEDFPSANPTTASDRIDPEAKQMSRTRLGTNCDMNEQYIPTGVSTLEMRGEKPQKFLLACPFFRKDVQKYRNCMKFMLHRVKDVKQHLQRHHMKPDFYCARCFKVFATSQARDQHSRDIQCPCKEGPKFDGISEQQQKRLSRNSNRGRDIDVQWFEMWDIIFPGHARPRTCYLGDYGEEFVSHLRSFWTKEKSDIWRIALEGNASEFDPDFCDRVMNVMFARFELEMSSSDHDKNEQPRQAKRACVRRHLKPATGGENKVDEEPWLKGDSGNISPQLELHVPKRN
ncbi:hypothetical protein BGZ63DRAFT_82624 [Mariannaea sp. PMI_226]|nr:hypothetical protein BGZ63DRAFT_82624 [Mariannaea sp. PMI_226]